MYKYKYRVLLTTLVLCIDIIQIYLAQNIDTQLYWKNVLSLVYFLFLVRLN